MDISPQGTPQLYYQMTDIIVYFVGLVELNRLHKSEEGKRYSLHVFLPSNTIMFHVEGVLNVYTMKEKTTADRLETR